MVKADIDLLLQKQMDRKDFLKHALIAVVVLSGLSSLLRTLLHAPTTQSSFGYGGSAYGRQKRQG